MAGDDPLGVEGGATEPGAGAWTRRLGAHLSLGQGLLRAAARAEALGIRSLQLFADNPTAWRRRATPPRELAAFRARLTELGIDPVVVHAPYLLNLASPDETVWQRSVDVLGRELVVASSFGASAIVLHLGSHLGSGSRAGISRIAQGIARALERAAGGSAWGPGDSTDRGAGGRSDGARGAGSDRSESAVGNEAGTRVRILLENAAGSGDAVGASIAELAAVVAAVEEAGVPADQVGICLDTAHAWSAGIAIDRPEGVDRLLDELEARIGLRRLGVVHLNDSRSELGSRVDRHEHLGAGRIGVEGLRRILVHPALAEVAYILETPGMDSGWDAVNLARAVAIAAGRPLDPLPPEAFSPRGRDSGRSGPPDEPDESPASAGLDEPPSPDGAGGPNPDP